MDQHQLDEDGEHWEVECEVCIERKHGVSCDCRCGNCCAGGSIVEATLRDAEREPRIEGECEAIETIGETREVVGWLLNDPRNQYACRFFDHGTRQCTIYETRPLGCRVFDCGEYAHAEKPPSAEEGQV